MSDYTHLSFAEREQIAWFRAEGLSLTAIAGRLGRAVSTITREVGRNALPKGGYQPVYAEGCYRIRRRRPAILERDERLRRFVHDRLLERWTPEQIAGWLKRGEERGLRVVCCETIYAFIHRPAQKAEKLWRLLPFGRSKRGRRTARPPRNPIPDRASIHDRPRVVDDRRKPGHWEGDLLICKRTRPLLVLKERKTRFVLVARLCGKSAAETVTVMMAVFRRLDPQLRTSTTFDNDTAFARHSLLRSVCDMTTWFCDAYASWQKGAVENANGRLRRQLPRHLDPDTLDDSEIQEIVLSHNLTPRKCLGFLTPAQPCSKSLARTSKSASLDPVALHSGIHPPSFHCFGAPFKARHSIATGCHGIVSPAPVATTARCDSQTRYLGNILALSGFVFNHE